MSHEQIARVFDTWAQNGRAEAMESGHGDVVRQVVAKMRFRPGQQILDLGCGNGWATRLLAKSSAGSSAVGIDVAPEMVVRAEQSTSLTIRARFEVARFEELPFRDASFDKAFSMEAIYYAVDLDRALAEVRRVLKPKGTVDLVLDCYAESASTKGWSKLVGLHMHCIDESSWRAALTRAGFTAIEARRVVDSRGPGDQAAFQPSAHAPNWQTQVELHAAGSLWLTAEKA